MKKESKLKHDIRLDKILVAISFSAGCFGFGWGIFIAAALGFILGDLIVNKK